MYLLPCYSDSRAFHKFHLHTVSREKQKLPINMVWDKFCFPFSSPLIAERHTEKNLTLIFKAV